MKISKYGTALLLALGVSASATMIKSDAIAQTATDTFVVRATVQASCAISANDLDFGTYDPAAGAADATSQIFVNCTAGTTYELALNGGQSGDIANRAMTGSTGDSLTYQLYTDAARSIVWGDGSTGQSVSGTGNGVIIDHPVYGRVVSNQYVTPGAYIDTITATVTF